MALQPNPFTYTSILTRTSNLQLSAVSWGGHARPAQGTSRCQSKVFQQGEHLQGLLMIPKAYTSPGLVKRLSLKISGAVYMMVPT